MFKFFTPVTKVQKDRAIMRETDARLAKYSRRGLIFNFLAFLLCLTGGNFVEREQGLAIVLTIGLLLCTLLRGYFLFRFEALYPRAPAKWRNRYFLATLLGATWWGFILVSITLVLQMHDVAPLLWLYTIVFFATTAHAFAPYQRFLTVYQFVGQVPAAVAALFIPDITAWLYAILLLAFYVMLVHQCRLMSEDYWQKLAATYALAKKTENLEEEKRGTQATAELNREFMNNLHTDLGAVVQLTETGMQELRAAGEPQLTQRLAQAQSFQARIFTSVDDFRNLLSNELKLESRVFNVRHELQALVSNVVDDAQERHIELESALSPTIPMHLEGDAVRFAQIIHTMLTNILHNSRNTFVLVEADFLREFEASGDLQITVSRQTHGKKRFFQMETAEADLSGSLDLSVCKGLAETMDGTLLVAEDKKGNHQVRFRAKFNVPAVNNQLVFHRDLFAGHSILIVHSNPALIDVKRRELHALGMSVRVESQYRRAYQALVNSYRENTPIECVLFYLHSYSEEALEFNRNLLGHTQLRNTHQFIACANDARAQVEQTGFVHLLSQPVGLYELGMALYEVYSENEATEALWLLFIDTDEVDEFDTQVLQGSGTANTGVEVTRIKAGDVEREYFSEDNFHLVVMECRPSGSSCSEIVQHIRQYEQELGKQNLLPIIGVGWEKVDNFYEQGFDHFIDLSQHSAQLGTILRYWTSL